MQMFALVILKRIARWPCSRRWDITQIEFEEVGKSNRYEKIFQAQLDKSVKLPWVVKVAMRQNKLAQAIRSLRASLLPPRSGTDGAPQLGGSHLRQHDDRRARRAPAAEDNLDRYDPEPLEELVNLLQAREWWLAGRSSVEALVIEVNTSKLQDLGVEWRGSQGSGQASFERSSIFSGKRLGSFIFSRDGFGDFMNFRASIEALAERGDAEVLSSPSVLVLNDRQARIQVGRQIPIARTTATTSSVAKGDR